MSSLFFLAFKSLKNRFVATSITVFSVALSVFLVLGVERIREAASTGIALCIRAGGTKDFYGNAPVGERLDPREWCGIVDYDASELVVTARAGTPLAELEAALAEKGQALAFEPPHFGTGPGGGATVGGMLYDHQGHHATFGAAAAVLVLASLLAAQAGRAPIPSPRSLH